MHPINFEGSNITFTRPEDMTDGECYSCPALAATDESGFAFVLVAVQPNKEDIEAINAGAPIYLKFIGAGLRPFCIFTIDKDGNGNF